MRKKEKDEYIEKRSAHNRKRKIRERETASELTKLLLSHFYHDNNASTSDMPKNTQNGLVDRHLRNETTPT